MDTTKIQKLAKEYKEAMVAIDEVFPITKEAMALSVWTQLSPMERYEIMSSVEKMPKSMTAKQSECLKVIEATL